MAKLTPTDLMLEAHKESEKSVARRLKVGAVIDDHGILTLRGYNHMPVGYSPECDHEVFTDEYEVIGLESYPNVIHAEVDIITQAAKSGTTLRDTVMYITDSPCLRCAELIVSSGISRVVYDREYRIKDGLEYLKNNGVEVEQLSISR